MITFTKEEQALLDRGWPRMIRLVDGHPHDKNAEKAALSWASRPRDDSYHSEFPREVARVAVAMGPRWIPRGKRAAIAKGEPRDLLAKHVATFTGGTTSEHGTEYVFLVEAFIGADATLEAIADGFESMRGEPRDVFQLAFKTGVAAAVGFLLLRAKNQKTHVKRLEAFRRTLASKKQHWHMLAGYLDASLHGGAGLRRWLGSNKHSLIWAEYARDDPHYVEECVAECDDDTPMSVRLVAIAGTSVMKNITRRKFYASDLRAVVRDFGMIRAPETVDLILSLVGRSTAKGAPAKWFTSHAEFAMPIVEAYASRGSTRAKAVISAMRKAGARPSS
jgi:hypothetical protein